MNEYSGGLLQMDTNFLETADQEVSRVPDTKTENKEAVKGSHRFSWLKKVSFGQYRTPLYYNK